jgi:hypothetical protein
VRAEVKTERSARAARAALRGFGFPGTRGPVKTKGNESSVSLPKGGWMM